jgi:hypothetical protein
MPGSDTFAPLTLMRRVQQLQQIGHPASQVNRYCRQVPCSLTPAAGAAPADDANLLGRLSDLAYGYRLTERGLSRRAPSAGAMYPIEVVWLTQVAGRWVFRWFDARYQRCVDLDGPADAAAAALWLGPGQHALLLVAVAWRTIQRYGVRGYRYTLLDAGNVLGNVAAAAVAAGAYVNLPEDVPHELLHRSLGLSRDELLLGVAVLNGDLRPTVPDLAPAAAPESLDTARLFGTEQPPIMAPALERVRRLHRAARPDRQHRLNFRAMLGGQTAEQTVRNILSRSSARAFSGAGLEPAALAMLDAYLHRVVEAAPAPVLRELELRLVARRADGWSSRWFDQELGVWHSKPIPEPDPAELIEVFGDQPLAATCTAFVILGMRGELGTQADPLVYRQTLLTAGVACAGAYHLASQVDVGTTTFGGFDDRRVAALADGSFIPLVVQSFGVTPAGAADVKNDTVASARWLEAGPRPTPEEKLS